MIRFEDPYNGPIWINPHQVLSIQRHVQSWELVHADGTREPQSRTCTHIQMYGLDRIVQLVDTDPDLVVRRIEAALNG